MLERWPWALAAVLWAALIYVLSSIPAGDGGLDLPDIPGVDKVAHAASFGVLTVLLAQALKATGNVASLVLAVVLASAYGVTDEVHQRFTPGRDPDVLDWVADTVGAIIAALGVWFLRR